MQKIRCMGDLLVVVTSYIVKLSFFVRVSQIISLLVCFWCIVHRTCPKKAPHWLLILFLYSLINMIKKRRFALWQIKPVDNKQAKSHCHKKISAHLCVNLPSSIYLLLFNVFQKILILLPELIHKRWQYHSIGEFCMVAYALVCEWSAKCYCEAKV